MIMNERTPVPGYKLLPSPSMKLKLKDNHYETPCIILEWQFVQICVIYRIKVKLPKHKIPCPGLIYQVIQGCI